MSPPRRRPIYALLVVATVALGLISRSHLLPVPKDVGDVLYATMAFWLIALLAPSLPSGRAAAAALAFCFAIEAAKLIPSAALVKLRHQRLGHLVLGTGFQASNLVCYLIGVGIGLGLEWAARVNRGSR